MSAENKSYLPTGLVGLSPWGSKALNPRASSLGGDSATGSQGQGHDHVLSHRHRLSLKEYPTDCPSLQVRWFHAVDVPKRKPGPRESSANSKPAAQPKKFVSFSVKDSRAIEAGFQKLVAEEDATVSRERTSSGPDTSEAKEGDVTNKPDASADETGSTSDPDKNLKIPVNEDYLFDVSIQERELAPAYWLGPVYEVRRGTWFYQESSTLRPCDENLATQLEEGYLKVKPFRNAIPVRTASQPRPTTSAEPDVAKLSREAKESDSKRSVDDLTVDDKDDGERFSRSSGASSPVAQSQSQTQTHRLFGAYMNSMVTYQDAKTAWILTDDFLSRMGSTVYQRLVGGGFLGGTKVVRGFTDANKPKEVKSEGPQKAQGDTVASSDPKERSGTQEMETTATADDHGQSADQPSAAPTRTSSANDPPPQTRFRRALERQMTDLVASTTPQDREQQEEAARKRDEQEMQDDYRDDEGEDQGREIEHLVLVTHGIGQRLGLRMESVNFVHDVNVLRKTLKGVYGSSPELQALNAEVEKPTKNSRVQVLPVCWRHLLDFPKESVRQNRKDHDLTDLASLEDEESYPGLDDITVEGVPAVRNLITDLALDVLLYQSAYREHISRIVQRESNRIYKLFMARNPGFKGQVSLMGHSLGSAILFDVLCRQAETPGRAGPTDAARKRPLLDRAKSSTIGPQQSGGLDLDFPVDSFFCVGSPIGLFQMLKGRTIAARQPPVSSNRSQDGDLSQERPTFSERSTSASTGKLPSPQHLPLTVASPKCAQLYNIFHPTDPISYRIEPLISSAMSILKPQPLPYTKKGIFGAPVGQGLSGISARVGQSVSGLWTSLSSGIASSILNRSLGITGEDMKAAAASSDSSATRRLEAEPLSAGAGTNIIGGNVIPGPSFPAAPFAPDSAEDRKRKLENEVPQPTAAGEHPPTLMDANLETLYAGFQKRRKGRQNDNARDLRESPEWDVLEARARRLRDEEAKVRALNTNGRVDYSIQEGVFDISLIASIASHLSYWADEDVSHFMISQLLSRHRVLETGQEIKERWSDVKLQHV